MMTNPWPLRGGVKMPERRGLFQLPALVAAMLCMAAAPAAWGQFVFSAKDGEALLVRYSGQGGGVVIPATWNGMPVTRIGQNAFQGFYAQHVTSVTIAESVRSILPSAFDGCLNMTNVTLPNSLTSIETSAFYRCAKLPSILIPANVTNIAASVFAGCSSLAAILVDPGNPSYSDRDGVLFDKAQTRLIKYPDAKAGSRYEVPEGVASIDALAFGNAGNCQTVSLPASLEAMGFLVFQLAPNLVEVLVDDSNPHFTSRDGVLFAKDLSYLFVYPKAKLGGHYEIPEGVISLEALAFDRAIRLTSLIIPNSVAEFGISAFSGCSNLTTLAIGAGVGSIDSGAFDSAVSLSTVTIGRGVTNITTSAFSGCANIRRFYFDGDAPSLRNGTKLAPAPATVFHLPGTTGWESMFGELPTQLWNPAIAVVESGFGLGDGRFQFTLTGNTAASAGAELVVEAAAELDNPQWSAISTNVLAEDGTARFTDPAPATGSSRFYRFRVR